VRATSVTRALDVLEFLSQKARPTPAAVIRRHCDIPKSSLHHLLHQLEDKGYAVYHREEHGWTLGSRVADLTSDAPLFSQALAVLEAFPPDAGGLTRRGIARATGLPPSTVERIVSELELNDFVTSRPDGSYTLGLELASLSARIRWLERYRLAARAELVHLRDVTGETANLVVKDGDRGLYLDQVESRSPLRYSGWVGWRVPMEGTATGAAFADAYVPHVVADAVEAGVTAIACGVGDVDPPLVVSILAPTGRLEMTGVQRASHWVEAAARQIGDRLADVSAR
jgi:DNA-binding IclR family transcriptional regulator